MAATPGNLDDYSPSSTVIFFDHPIPLLRVPILAGPSNDPSAGPYLLAFKNSQTFAAAKTSTAAKIIRQCNHGARIGCAITASNICKPPWWKTLIGLNTGSLSEKEECEEREMAACVALAKEKCVEFATEKCLVPFRDARVAVNVRKVNWYEVSKIVGIVSAAKGKSLTADLLWSEELKTKCLSKCVNEITNIRGSEVLDFDTK